MFKKRGVVVWGQLLTIIVGAVVILFVADVLFGGKLLAGTKDAAKDLWGYTISGQKDFVPYEEKYSSEEETVDKSIRALTFAIERVADKTSLPSVNRADIPDCNDVVEKKEEKDTDKVCCSIQHVDPTGPRIYYEYNEMTRADCKGKGSETDATEIRCSDLFFKKERYLCIDCENPEVKCEVKGFELPQKVDFWEDYIKGVGDPKYLVYYEKFPKGEEKAWQFESKTLFMVGLAARGALALGTVGGSKLLLPFTDILEGLKSWRIKRLVKLTEGLENLNDAARQRRLIKINKQLDKLREAGKLDEGLNTLVKSATRGIAGVNAEAITDDAAGVIFREIANIKKSGNFNPGILDSDGFPIGGSFTDEGKGLLRGSISKIKTDSGFDYPLQEAEVNKLIEAAEAGQLKSSEDVARILRGTDNIDEVAEGIAKSISYTKLGELGKRIGFKNMVKTYIKKGTLEKPVRQGLESLKTLKKTNPELYKKHIEELDGLMKGFVNIDEEGKLVANFNALFGDVEEDALMAMLRTVDDAGNPTALGVHIEEMSDLLNAKTWAEGTLYGSIKTISGPLPAGATKWETARAFMVNQLRGVGCVPPAPVLSKTASVACVKFIKDHYLPVLYTLGYLYALSEKDLTKYQGTGKNNIGVLDSESYAAGPRIYTTPNADNYFISIIKDDGSRERFFAVSPCKIDYKTSKGYCTCKLDDGDFVYKLEHNGEKTQTIDLTTGKISTEYMWDYMDNYEKTTFLVGNGFEEIKSIISNDEELLNEYFDILFADPRIYSIILRNNRAYGGDIQKIESLTPEQFQDFKNKLIAFYSEQEELFYPEFSYSNGVQIEIPMLLPDVPVEVMTIEEIEIVDNPVLKEPMFPFIDEIPFGYSDDVSKLMQKASVYWSTKDRDQSTYPWDNVNKPWKDKNIDWGKLQSYSGDKVSLVKEMLAHKIYHTEFFDNMAREAAFKYYIIENPSEDIVKKCTGMVETRAPNIGNLDEFQTKTVVPCVFIKPDMTAYSSWNDGDNYCYSNKNLALQYTEYTLDTVGIIGGLALMGFTGGTSAFVAVGAADIGAITTSFILKACGDWPNHEASFKGCFS